GWLICVNSSDAQALRRENRNGVASSAIEHALNEVRRVPSAWPMIEESFKLLREGARQGRFSIVTPQNRTETVYVLVKVERDARRVLAENRIRVMWGSEYGLSDKYIRVETLEPSHVGAFVDAINS